MKSKSLIVRNGMAVILAALLVACLFVGITTSVADAGSAKPSVDTVPAYTYVLGEIGVNTETTFYYRIKQAADGWKEAIRKAVELTDKKADNRLVKVVLADDWTASNGVFGNETGSQRAFNNGGLMVPTKANIILDLNGHILNRNMPEDSWTNNPTGPVGSVMYLHGNVEIVDSNPTAAHTDEKYQYINAEGVRVPVQGGIITGGKSSQGGAILTGGNVTLSGGTLFGNKASEYGGAVYVTPNVKTFTMNDGAAIIGNVSQSLTYTVTVGEPEFPDIGGDEGGEIPDPAPVETEERQTAGNGGAIATTPTDSNTNANIVINGGLIVNNTADNNGGAIYAQKATVNVSNATISANTANGTDSRGGAIYISGCQTAKITNCVFEANSSVSAGGAVYGEDNVSAVEDGAVTAYTLLEISGCTFDNNDTDGNGGAIYVSGESTWFRPEAIIVANSEFIGNSADKGGVVNVGIDTGARFSGSNMRNNVGESMGATYYVESGAKVEVAGGTVTGNLSNGTDGVSVYVNNGQISFDGNAVIDETDCESIYVKSVGGTSASATIKNATVEGKVYGEGGSSYINVGGKAVVDVIDSTTDVLVKAVSAFDETAKITIYGNCNASLIDSYAKFNSPDGYAINPIRNVVFQKELGVPSASDSVVVSQSGSVIALENTAPLQWYVKYDGEEYQAVNDYGVAFTYGEKKVVGIKVNDEVNELSEYGDVKYEGQEVSVHNVDFSIGTATVTFGVYVAPASIEENFNFNLIDANENNCTSFGFSGQEVKPTVKATMPDGTDAGLSLNNDYSVEYKNNVNIGDGASAIVSGIGNYTGTVELGFAITLTYDLTYVVEWEYFNAVENAFVSSTTGFPYNGYDQSGNIRAKLSIRNQNGDRLDYVEYVYAEGQGSDNPDRSEHLTLVFSDANGNRLSFVNALGYTVSIDGVGNAVLLAKDKVSQISILPITIDIDAADLESGAAEGLWSLYFGEDKVALMDGANVSFLVDGVLTNGDVTKTDAYAYYRGNNALNLRLDKEFAVGSLGTLGAYLNSASISYNHNTVLDAKIGKINTIETSVTISFGGNFTTVSGENTMVLSKTWYVVTAHNAVRTTETEKAELEWTYADKNFISTAYAYRPEHGDWAYYTFLDKEGNAIDKFKVDFTANGLIFYDVDLASGEISEEATTGIYNLYSYLYELSAGNYTLKVEAPDFQSEEEHSHWWNENIVNDYGVVYATVAKEVPLTVKVAALTNAGNTAWAYDIIYNAHSHAVTYNGEANNTPTITLAYKGKTLVQGIDYLLTSTSVVVTGSADLTITGIGNFSGTRTLVGEFSILKAQNYWERVPSIQSWKYGDFDSTINVIVATPKYLANPRDMWFKVARDEQGLDVCEGLDHIYLEDGRVSAEVSKILSELGFGNYYLISTVDASQNYDEMVPATVGFRVLQGVNTFVDAIKVQTWVQGKFNIEENLPTATTRWGEAHIVVTDLDKNEVYYDSATGVNMLGGLNVGKYMITVTVGETEDYMALSDFLIFEVFEKPGLPWWAILLIVIGSLGVVAAVLYILHEKGILQMLTGKAIIAMRTKATVDATIAAVRANKIAEAAKRSLAEAEAREKAEAENADDNQ